MPADLSCDKFLGGKLRIHQPKYGHRAGVDPVLLAAAVDAKSGQSVLELGGGVGVVSLCLGWRVPGLELTALEIQADYGELAQRNACENQIEMNVVTADIADLPFEIRQQSFDHVVANPPYYQRGQGTAATDAGRETSLAGETPLAVWVEVATKRLKPGGLLTFIQKADRLHDLLYSMDRRLGSVIVKPLAPRVGRAAELVIIQAKKGGRARFRLLAPEVMHQGDRHERDGDSYSPRIAAILRSGAPLKIAD